MCAGVCRDLMREHDNCGSCGTSCGTDEVCHEGACALDCPGGFTECEGACFDLDSDRFNCGACDAPCGEGHVCEGGTCTVTCAAPLVDCSGVCSDTRSDPDNCGACGSPCTVLGEACIDGSCVMTVWRWAGPRTFTNCSATGATGPTQAQCDTAYAGTTLDGEVTVTGGIQAWVAPTSATYRIEAFGAQGMSADPGYDGGLGARMRGDFDITAGTTVYIIVGQEGTMGTGTSSGGGGGGSFVVDATDTPWIVAGGGGGTRTSVSQDGCDGRTTEYGGTASGSGMTHSCTAKTADLTMGGIVSAVSWGSGGGGLVGNGAADSSYGDGGDSWLNGGTGGIGTSCGNSHGGFGGGGSGNGCNGGGGGGGYSGGDGGRVAGGGGSYNSGTNQDNAAGVNTGQGYVIIDVAP
jgi:hypothetical protein